MNDFLLKQLRVFKTHFSHAVSLHEVYLSKFLQEVAEKSFHKGFSIKRFYAFKITTCSARPVFFCCIFHRSAKL